MTDFQVMAGIQGRAFEDWVATGLQFWGWTVIDRHRAVEEIEIDIVAIDDLGYEWWIECKGSHRGKTPGARRGDTVKKAIGVAWAVSQLDDPKPYMLITSHMPAPDTVGGRLLKRALDKGLFARIAVMGWGDHIYSDDLEEDA